MNIKHLFFYMLLIAFSSCSKPGYEKAIAEWVQTDFHGTWTDLKFELLEVLEIEDVTVSDSLRHLNNKSAQLSAVIQKAESPRALFKPSFSAYMEAEKSLMMMDVKWNAYYGSWQNVIADNDSLLQIVADYQLIKQNIQDSISAKRHYIQSLEDFTVAETFLSAQDSVYEKFHTDALEYSLIKQLAPQLEQLKGKEQILFAEIQEHYEKAKAAAEEFNELQPRINKIEQRYIDLKNTSDKIQALEYKPWFQRIKDYLFGLAAVSMILLFVNALQSKIQMLKQTRENAKKLKQMQNKEEDDYPSI